MSETITYNKHIHLLTMVAAYMNLLMPVI